MLLEKGHNVIEYTRNNNEIENMNVIKKALLPFTMIYSFKTKREIKKIIKENNIDIVHVHNTLNLISASVYNAAKQMNIPVVQTVHNFRLLCPNGLFYREKNICEDCPKIGLKCAIKHNCYRNSKFQTIINVLMLKTHRFSGIYKYPNYIFLTEFNKNKFIEYNKKLKIFDENKFYVKPNFIDCNFDTSSIKKQDKQFIYAGRLDENKGIKDIVYCWKEVNDNKLLICGTGILEEELKKYTKENNLNIEFLGFLNKNELLRKMAESQALIFPSKWYETFGLTILEANSVNTPVIAKNIGNASSIINNNGIKYNNNKELISIIDNFKYGKKITMLDLFKKENNYEELNKIYNLLK